jgi:FPC/CPF motif-containing protein YcgG
VLAVALDVHTDSKGRSDGGEKRLVRRRIQQYRGNLLDADLAWVGL